MATGQVCSLGSCVEQGLIGRPAAEVRAVQGPIVSAVSIVVIAATLAWWKGRKRRQAEKRPSAG